MIVWLLFLNILCLAQNGSFAQKTDSNSTAKSQFDLFQNDYDIVMEIGEFPTFNTSYMKYARGGFVPYNRTQRVLNYTSQVIKDIKDIRLDIQLYKFMSNEYRFFPLTVSVNACLEYQLNSFRSKDLLVQFSNINPCHLQKGLHYIYNGLPDFSKFPPFMPRGRYKMVVKFCQDEDFVLEADFYGAVKDKPKKWR